MNIFFMEYDSQSFKDEILNLDNRRENSHELVLQGNLPI